MCVFLLMLNVPVNNFSVMSARSHRFLGITSTFWGINVSLLKDTTRRRLVSNPRSLAPESEAFVRVHVFMVRLLLSSYKSNPKVSLSLRNPDPGVIKLFPYSPCFELDI